MTLHMTISMVAPILLVLAAPRSPWRCARCGPAATAAWARARWCWGWCTRGFLRVLGNPVVAAALFFGSLVVFYYSPLFGSPCARTPGTS